MALSFTMYDFKRYLVDKECSTATVLQVLNNVDVHIALVVDEKLRLLGTITDGDIRRALLAGKTTDAKANEVMNPNYRSATEGTERSMAIEIMNASELNYLPLLDGFGRVTNLLLKSELSLPVKINNPVVIMAGGQGTRLRPFTQDCPKPMLPVDGKPMLEILLDQYIAKGFHEFYISVNYLKEKIMDYFKDGSDLGVSITYLIEDFPLGTAGSLALLPADINDPFLLLNGDVLTRLDPQHLLQFHNDNGCTATLCVREYQSNVPFGVVNIDGVHLHSIDEKPTFKYLVNAGIYVLDPCILPSIPANTFTDMPDLLQSILEKGANITVCPIHEYWIDVGIPETLQKAHDTWRASSNSSQL